MVVILGFIVLIAAVGVMLVGVLTNSGSIHALDNFGIFGYHFNNASTGLLFLYGAVVGVVGMLGLILLWVAFTRRMAASGMRRELKSTKNEAEVLRQDRDRLNRELEIERSNNHRASSSNPTDAQLVAE